MKKHAADPDSPKPKPTIRGLALRLRKKPAVQLPTKKLLSTTTAKKIIKTKIKQEDDDFEVVPQEQAVMSDEEMDDENGANEGDTLTNIDETEPKNDEKKPAMQHALSTDSALFTKKTFDTFGFSYKLVNTLKGTG